MVVAARTINSVFMHSMRPHDVSRLSLITSSELTCRLRGTMRQNLGRAGAQVQRREKCAMISRQSGTLSGPAMRGWWRETTINK